jgi:hypothetical protein
MRRLINLKRRLTMSKGRLIQLKRRILQLTRPYIPGKAPITLNTKENSEKVTKKETILRIKDTNNKMKAEG